MNQFQAFFTRIVTYLEAEQTPLKRYVFLFCAILSLRLTLEFFSNNRLFTLADIIHIGLWFVFIVLAFLIQLQWFSGEAPQKVIKLVITCFSIALTAPLIDMLVSHGTGVKMNYLSLNNWKDVVYAYFTIGGPSLSRGATLGIRIEIVLLVLASFNYVFTKTRRVWRSLLAAGSIYTVLFLSGTIPFLMTSLMRYLQLSYATDDNSTSLLLLLLDVILIFILCFRLFTTPLKTIVKWMDWWRVLTAICLFCTGSFQALHQYPDNWKLDPSTLLTLPLLICLMVVFCFYFYYIRYQRGKLFTTGYSIENTVLVLLLVISMSVSYKTFLVSLLVWGILFMLYEPPLYLNRFLFPRILLMGMFSAAIVLGGFVSFGAPLVGFPQGALVWGIVLTAYLSAILHVSFSKWGRRLIAGLGILILAYCFAYHCIFPEAMQAGALLSLVPCVVVYVSGRIRIEQTGKLLLLFILFLFCYVYAFKIW